MADPSNDPIKDMLISIKTNACSLKDRVQGLTGPLTDPLDQEFVKQKVEAMAADSTTLLNDEKVGGQVNPLQTEPSTWIYWSPIDTTGMTLSDLGTSACREACKALDDYCSGVDTGDDAYFVSAARANFRVTGLPCAILESAGIDDGSSESAAFSPRLVRHARAS